MTQHDDYTMVLTLVERECVIESDAHYTLDGVSFTVYVVSLPSNHEYDRAFLDENEASRYAERLAMRTQTRLET